MLDILKAARRLKIPLRQHFILQRIAATNRVDKCPPPPPPIDRYAPAHRCASVTYDGESQEAQQSVKETTERL